MRAEQLTTEELGSVTGNYWRLIDGDDVVVDRVALPATVTDETAALAAILTIRDEKADPAREAKLEAEAKAMRQAEEDAQFVARGARLGYVKHSDLNGLIDARIAQRPSKN